MDQAYITNVQTLWSHKQNCKMSHRWTNVSGEPRLNGVSERTTSSGVHLLLCVFAGACASATCWRITINLIYCFSIFANLQIGYRLLKILCWELLALISSPQRHYSSCREIYAVLIILISKVFLAVLALEMYNLRFYDDWTFESQDWLWDNLLYLFKLHVQDVFLFF